MPEQTNFPQSLGKYTLLSEIGRGGFAVVYRARDEKLEREVAIKVLHPALAADSGFAKQFLHEAKVIANLRHPGIVVLYEADEIDGRLFLAMELVEGEDLKTKIEREGPQPVEEIGRVIGQVAQALAYAHKKKVIHRDIKSGNILLEEDGQVVLTDFGLARMAAHSRYASTMALSGGLVGTIEYMSPEQVEGQEATEKSDLYGLGVVAYEMATGSVPFQAATPVAVMRMVANKEPRDPKELRPELPDGMRDAILKAMAKNPEARQENVKELAEEWEGVETEGHLSISDRPPEWLANALGLGQTTKVDWVPIAVKGLETGGQPTISAHPVEEISEVSEPDQTTKGDRISTQDLEDRPPSAQIPDRHKNKVTKKIRLMQSIVFAIIGLGNLLLFCLSAPVRGSQFIFLIGFCVMNIGLGITLVAFQKKFGWLVVISYFYPSLLSIILSFIIPQIDTYFTYGEWWMLLFNGGGMFILFISIIGVVAGIILPWKKGQTAFNEGYRKFGNDAPRGITGLLFAILIGIVVSNISINYCFSPIDEIPWIYPIALFTLSIVFTQLIKKYMPNAIWRGGWFIVLIITSGFPSFMINNYHINYVSEGSSIIIHSLEFLILPLYDMWYATIPITTGFLLSYVGITGKLWELCKYYYSIWKDAW